MTATQGSATRTGRPARPVPVEMKLEVAILGVSDVDRAKAFYEQLGWRLDADFAGGDFRVVQLTPFHSPASVFVGKGLPSPPPGASSLALVVEDVDAARAELVARGVEVSEVFHFAGGPFNNTGENPRVTGRDPEDRSYFSFASFEDPDGNRWFLQEITTRLPGRLDPGITAFGSASDLAGALRRAAAAHGEHEQRLGQADPNWPDWYAEYMAAEQAGGELPA